MPWPLQQQLLQVREGAGKVLQARLTPTLRQATAAVVWAAAVVTREEGLACTASPLPSGL